MARRMALWTPGVPSPTLPVDALPVWSGIAGRAYATGPLPVRTSWSRGCHARPLPGLMSRPGGRDAAVRPAAREMRAKPRIQLRNGRFSILAPPPCGLGAGNRHAAREFPLIRGSAKLEIAVQALIGQGLGPETAPCGGRMAPFPAREFPRGPVAYPVITPS